MEEMTKEVEAAGKGVDKAIELKKKLQEAEEYIKELEEALQKADEKDSKKGGNF